MRANELNSQQPFIRNTRFSDLFGVKYNDPMLILSFRIRYCIRVEYKVGPPFAICLISIWIAKRN